MSLKVEPAMAEGGASAFMNRMVGGLGAAHLLMLVCALVFALLVYFSEMGPVSGVLGFAAVTAAVYLLRGLARPRSAARGVWLGPVQRGSEAAALVARLPDAAFLMDRQGRVLFQNTPAATAFGRIGRGQPISFLLRAPEVGEALSKALAEGIQVNVTYYERVPTDRWYEARVAPLTPEDAGDNPPPFVLLLLRDLTAAQRVEQMRADFVANASHELRTPLASLSGFIETLQGPARGDVAARERFLEVMAEQARRMSRLIDDLMSLSRIELKAHVRPETVVDLRPVIEHVVDAMGPLAHDSGVELGLDLPAGEIPVTGDRDELAQVVQNLVHNAIKYGHEGGRVDVSASRRQRARGKPDLVSVSVRDYGPGIPPEHLPRLTERFYRVDAASSREKGGTGLGLAIVKHIMTRHRGQLAIESEAGEGAVFTVQLDAAPPDAEAGDPQVSGEKSQ